MYKKKLRDFIVEYATEEYSLKDTPCTLYQALTLGGRLVNIDFGNNLNALMTLPRLPFSVRTKLYVNKELLSYSHIALRLCGVDAPCTVTLGESCSFSILDSARSYIFEIGEYLKEGEHTLRFAFDAPVDKSTFSSTFDDWSERGLFSDIELIGYNTTFIESVKCKQIHENGKVTLHISCKTYGKGETPEIVATLVSPSGQMYYLGLHRGKGELLITDPILWWPHTLGKPNLYRLTLTMYVGGEPEDNCAVMLGLREVALSLADPMGESELALTVGGERFFVTGAEYCPSACLVNDESDAHLLSLMRSYVRANVNLLFVGENNRHLSPKFYDYCDKFGLLVMQDIPSPAEAAKSEEATEEYLKTLCHILSRVTTHPSLALLRSHLTGEDSIREIPRVLTEEAPDAVYTNIFISKGQSLNLVDTTSTFASLDAPASFPAMRSLRRFVAEDKMNPYSETLEARATSTPMSIFDKAAERYPYAMGMEQIVYLSQLSQSDATSEGVQFMRLRRGRAMGLILNMTNDPAGRISPSIADYYGVEKAVCHTLHDLYAPDALFVRRDGYRMYFYVSNETASPIDGVLVYRLLDATNEILKEERVPVHIEKDTLAEVHSADFSSLAHKRENEVYLHASLMVADTELHSVSVLFVLPKRFAYQNPKIEKRIERVGSGYVLTLTPHAFAHRVSLAFSDTDATFSHNFFDLTKNAPVRVTFQTKGDTPSSVDTLLSTLRVISVYDIGK